MLSIKKAYKDYLKTVRGAKIYNQFKNIFYTKDDTLITSLKAFIEIPKSCSDHIEVLDVGGGDGKRIRQILKFLHENTGKKIGLDFIEQSSVFTEEFIRTKQDIEKFSEIRIFNNEFENVQINKKYDYIFIIHSIFAFENIGSIKKLFENIKKDGKIYFISNSSDSFLGKLKIEADKDYSDKRFEINELFDFFSSINLSYDVFYFKTQWRTSYKNLQKQMNTLLEWITLGKYKNFTKEKQEKIVKFILDSDNPKDELFALDENEVSIVIDGKEIQKVLPYLDKKELIKSSYS